MSDSTLPQPSSEDLADFVRGDPLAIDRVIGLIAEPLCRWAWKEHEDLPPDDVEELVYEALAETARNHARYDQSASLITTYVINLIRWRIKRLGQNVQKIRRLEDTSLEAQEKLPRAVYNQTDAREIEIRIARQRFYVVVRERLQGLDKELFELMLQGAESKEYVKAVERGGSFSDPDAEAKNRKARVHRSLRAIAKEMDYELEDLMRG
jgi:hypothetical protein